MVNGRFHADYMGLLTYHSSVRGKKYINSRFKLQEYNVHRWNHLVSGFSPVIWQKRVQCIVCNIMAWFAFIHITSLCECNTKNRGAGCTQHKKCVRKIQFSLDPITPPCKNTVSEKAFLFWLVAVVPALVPSLPSSSLQRFMLRFCTWCNMKHLEV